MSATIGTREARTICFIAAVDSTSGHETRMMSTPASSQRRIWSIVAFASEVSVLVIVCTLTGNGLKDPQWALADAPDPVIVPVDSDAAARALGLIG